MQDIIKIDYQGNPEYTTRELGDWDSARQYLKGYDQVAKGYYIDRVWCDGSLWEAAVALPTIGARPSLTNADWVRRLHSGADGRDGRDGVDGTDGRDGIDGIDGTDGRDGVDGKDGKDGKDGSDGTSVRTAYSFASYPSDPWEGIVVLIDYSDARSDMIDVLENGVWESYIVDVGSVYICDLDHHYYEATATGWRDCGRFTGADGKDGKDGKDGTDGTDGKDGKDGKDGESAVTYEIVPSVPAIKMDSSGTVTTGIIGITAYKTEAGTRTSCSFSASGSKYYIVYFSVDGGQWRACSWISPGGGAATVYGVPGSYVQSAKVGIAFRLSLHDNNATPAESVVYETQGISVVEDGAKGSNGKAGKNYYYDKYFVSTKEYISTEYQAPYVSFEWQDGGVLRVSQYMLIADSNRVNGVLVAPRIAAAAGVWEVMNHDFNYLITTATFSDFGKLATSVFTGDWRISQYGVPAKAISAAGKNLVRLFVETDGQYPVSDLATMLSEEGAEIYEEYSDFYGYTDEEIDTVADICIWAVGAMPNSTDEERFNIIQSISNSSYQLFGFNPDDPFALFKPNIAEDMLNGKTYLRDVYVRGTIAKNTLRINAGNAQEYCNYGGGGTTKYDRDQMFVNIPAGYEYVQLEFLQDGNGHSAVSGYVIVLLPEITEDMVGSSAVSGYVIVLLPEITEDMVGSDLIIVNATDSEGETSGKTMTVQSGTANPVGNDGEKNRWLLRGIPKGIINSSVYSSSNPNGSLKRVSLSKQYEVTLRAVPMKVNNVNSGQYGWIVSNLRSIE